MKKILLMRHAKSSWDNENLSDHDRPLNSRGLGAAEFMGQFLRENNLIPDQIIGSTALRVKETIKIMLQQWKSQTPFEFRKDLYLASAHSYAQAFATVDENATTVMLVAHNPGLEVIVSRLMNSDEAFPTATIAEVQVDADSFYTASKRIDLWQIQNIYRPKEVGFRNDD